MFILLTTAYMSWCHKHSSHWLTEQISIQRTDFEQNTFIMRLLSHTFWNVDLTYCC